jgi:hypothetical protein
MKTISGGMGPASTRMTIITRMAAIVAARSRLFQLKPLPVGAGSGASRSISMSLI